jgi:site-specific DNA recombinase
MKTIAALYARVSTQRQEDEATIASQIAMIEDYADKQGYVLSKELYYLDEAVSGARLDRPGLDRLRDQASEGMCQVVVCLSPDRLARQYAFQVLLLDELRREGVEVEFVNSPQMGDNPQSQLLLGIQGLFAEYERAIILERMRRGRLHQARAGKMAQPQTPYGYRYVRKDQPNGETWEIDEREAGIVRQIFDWYTQSKSVSISEITARLEAAKAIMPPRQAKKWAQATVGNILRQPQYTGTAYYNRTQNDYHEIGQPRRAGRGKRKAVGRQPRPEADWITIPVPAIIPQQTWLAAQERLSMNRQKAPRNNKRHPYLFRGLLVCATCGHTLIGRTYKDRTTYACNHGGKNGAPDLPPHHCSISEALAEPLIWQALTDLLHNPKLIAQAWQTSPEDETPSMERNEKERLEHRNKLLERQQERLLDLFQEEHLTKEAYLERKQRLAQDQKAIRDRLHVLEQKAGLEQYKQTRIADFEQFCQRIQASLLNPTHEQKLEVIRLLIDHVVVGDGDLTIKHVIPAETDCRLQLQRTSAVKFFYNGTNVRPVHQDQIVTLERIYRYLTSVRDKSKSAQSVMLRPTISRER